GQLRLEQLQRHLPVQRDLFGEVDLTHPALAQPAQELEVVQNLPAQVRLGGGAGRVRRHPRAGGRLRGFVHYRTRGEAATAFRSRGAGGRGGEAPAPASAQGSGRAPPPPPPPPPPSRKAL